MGGMRLKMSTYKKHIFGTILAVVLIATNSDGRDLRMLSYEIIDKTEEYKNNGDGWQSLKDKERVDGYTRIGDSIYGGEIHCYAEPLYGIDVGSFKVLAGTKYAKDTNHVYFPLEIMCADYAKCGACFYQKIVLENTNPGTFKYLENDYAVDGDNVFFNGKLMANVKGSKFKTFEGPDYFFFASDGKFVYFRDSVFDGSDPETFRFSKDDSLNITEGQRRRYIITDKHKKWKYYPPKSIIEFEQQLDKAKNKHKK